ncbi:MAG: hypothetical protein LBQ76_01365 [Candidatus Fibromonas sp.]|nr:hypothetical protein [Candidatus Fibromonas sp.]
MYCVIYIGGKQTTCTEMKDTKENKSKCDTQNKGLKMVRGEAWRQVREVTVGATFTVALVQRCSHLRAHH